MNSYNVEITRPKVAMYALAVGMLFWSLLATGPKILPETVYQATAPEIVVTATK
ncbi:MAG: hypothetical protein HGA38_01375 [Candidatus Moranbacteria bacterium]|nr:hypothetical protein [Candidatus Moranbacteria bacterium]